MFGGFSLISNWKYALIVALLVTIGLGKVYYEEKLENKQQEINQLEVNNLRLQQGIEQQNEEIQEWREENQQAKEEIEQLQEDALNNYQERREDRRENSLPENASCDESMEWLQEQAESLDEQ